LDMKIFITGFTGLFSDDDTAGIHKVGNMYRDDDIVLNLEHYDCVEILKQVKRAMESNLNQPIILVGHSFGGDSAIEIAQILEKESILVDLLIQVDSIGFCDEVLPANVTKGINIYTEDYSFPDGTHFVKGSKNIGLKNTSHTTIDEDPRTVEIIKSAISKVRSPYANAI